MKIIIAAAVLAAIVGVYLATRQTSQSTEDQFVDFVAQYRKSYLSTSEF